MPTVREFEQAFQEDPSNQQAYRALCKTYQDKQRFDKLVTLHESFAQALTDDQQAADLYLLAAEVRLDHLGDAQGAETVLQYALERNRAHVAAAERLKRLYRDQGRTGEYLTMLEMAAAAVVESGDPQRRATLDEEMAQLFTRHIARLEAAVQEPQRANEITPEALRTVVSARKIHKALGDWPTVLRLYDLEVAATADPKRRADLLVACAKLLSEKTTQLQAAADRLTEALRLRPNDERSLELQATLFARPEWPLSDGRERAAALYHQLARRRNEAGDLEGAISLCRRGLGALPGHGDCSAYLEKILTQAGRLKELDRYYRERAAEAATKEEKAAWLHKRAKLAQEGLKDEAEALRAYEELVAIEPPGGPAAQHLAQLYGGRKNYAKLADLRERQLGAVSDPVTRLPLLRELATLYRDRLGDPDQAAVYLHAILQLEPGDEAALKAYGDHFRRRGDFNALVDLLEFAADNALATGASTGPVAGWLQEVAGVAERNLNDVDRALSAWRKLEDLGMEVDQARETQKRLLLKEKRWDGMADLLGREAASAADDARRVDVWRRLAKLYLEKLGASGKAVETYRKILAVDPADAAAFRAVVDIFEAERRWPDLADVVRAHLDHVPRAERSGWLRRLGVLYGEHLGRPADAAWAAREVLSLVPGDRESYFRLEDMLEATGDLPGLAQVLAEHAEHVSEGEKAALLSRAARLHQLDLEQPEAAVALWERVLLVSPADAEALHALTGLYEELQRAEPLARLLELHIAQAEDEPAVQVASLRKLAHLAAGPLGDAARALGAWERLLTLSPRDGEALERLSDLYRAAGSDRKLADTLGVRVAVLDDNALAVPLALERALILERRLGKPLEAIEVLEQIIDGLDPRNDEAHARLRRLAEGEGDWQKVVNVVERQMLLHETVEARVAAAMEVAQIHRDRLGDPNRAMQGFERVLGMAPAHEPALEALAALYAVAGESERLVAINEKRLSLTEDPGARRRLMFDLADACEGGLSAPRKAFSWVARAHAERPDTQTWQRLTTLSESHDLWDELIGVYEAARARAASSQEQVEVAARIARIHEEKLSDPARAFSVLREALAAQPDGATLLPELERLAEATADWQGLLDVYMRVARGRPALAARAELLQKRAQVLEARLGNPSAAMDEWLRRFGLDHTDELARTEILRLAGRTGRWEDALRVYGQLFARAEDAGRKVSLAKQAAALVEERVMDRVRAFRAYLNAFRLDPEDAEIVSHLWRLAAVIGHFDAPAGHPPDVPELVVQAVGRSSTSPDATMHLSLGEPGALVDTVIEDVTDTLTLEDAEELEGPATRLGAPPVPVPKPPPSPPRPPQAPAPKQGFDSAWAEFANAYTLLPAMDTATRRRNLLKVAAIWEKGANDTHQAFEALEKAFRLDPFDAEVRGELERLAEERSEWARLCEIFLSVVSSSMAIEDAVAIHHRVAAIHERLGQTEGAEARYLSVVNLSAQDRRALDRLEDIYRKAGRWSDLAGLLERRRSESSLGATALRAKAVELAAHYEHQLDRPYEAIDTLERYLADFDDEPAGPAEADRLAQLRRVLDDLTRLYERVDLWSKAANATQRSLDLESQPEARKQLAMTLARIYERELASPAKAVEAFEALIAEDPNDAAALAALDRLYEALGRHEELAAILERRVTLATGEARLALVKRRARVLEEKLGNPDAAAANLRRLGAEMLDDDELAGALLRNLRRTGLGHEAARLLSQRIERLTATGAAAARVVDLHLELSRVRLEDMNDAEGALQALQAARALEPRHAEALAALAKLHLKRSDFGAYADARADEAEALGAGPLAAQALVEAGRVQRDQLGRKAKAVELFKRALAFCPAHTEAARALSSLLFEQGRYEEAATELRAFLEHAGQADEDAQGRADALTDLGRICGAQGAPSSEVAALYERAIDLVPDHQAALVALATLHHQEGQWEQAERRLMQALRRLKNNAEAALPLQLRLAEIYEKLGRPEDGYRQLQDAEKKDAGRLHLKIAMGRNRFEVRKWREALAHLEHVDSHAEAPAHAQEVGAALAMAGESSLKLKQNDKARELFGRALAHAPEDGRALRLLAELEMSTGALQEAAAHLRRLPEGAIPPIERAALLEQLGDQFQQQGDTEGARAAYEAAVRLVVAPTPAHLPLFDKTLALQQAAGALAEAAQTSARLIGLEPDPKQRAKRRREAAATLVKHGEHQGAAQLLAECLDDDATDELALAALVDVHDHLGTPQACMFRLERTLPALPDPGSRPQARERRVKLWHRLGQLRLGVTPDAANEGARRAFEQALALDPDHVASREALVDLHGAQEEAASLANHRALASANPTRVPSVRALAQGYLREGKIDGARCAIEVLSLLGVASEEERSFLTTHPVRALKADEPYGGVVGAEARQRWLLFPEAAAMAELFSAIWEGGLELDGPTLEEFGVSAEDKISPLSGQEVAKIFAEVGKALDNQRPGLYVAWDPKVASMQVALSRPPAVVMPSLLATDGEASVMRFWIGRTLELARPENVLAATIKPRAFSHLFGSVLKAFHPRHARRRGNDNVSDAAARLKKALPYRVAKRLGELFSQMEETSFSSARWRTVVDRTADRAGLLACGDLGLAARIVLGRALAAAPAELSPDDLRTHAARPGPLADLLRFAISEEHLRLRAELGLGAKAAAAA